LGKIPQFPVKTSRNVDIGTASIKNLTTVELNDQAVGRKFERKWWLLPHSFCNRFN
jgi:hypothetical protein